MVEEKKKATPSLKKKERKSKAYKLGKNCPRCGAGVRLADHKDRRSCGKCGYFEKK